MKKNNVKKNLAIVFLSGILFFSFFPQVFAQAINPIAPLPGQATSTDISQGVDLGKYVGTLYKAALIFGTFIAFLTIVWGGVLYVSSAANPGLKESAKSKIKNAIIGLALLLSVFVILRFLNPEILNPSAQSSSSPTTAQGAGRPINSSNPGSAAAGAPTDLTITRLQDGDLKITWKDNSNNEDHFEIEYKTSNTINSSDWEKILIPIPEGSQEYNISQEARFYRVVAVAKQQDGGAKNPSDQIASPGYPVGSSALAAPGAPSITYPNPINNPTAVGVQWVDNASNEESYLIQGLRSSPPDPSNPLLVQEGYWGVIRQVPRINQGGEIGSLSPLETIDNTANYSALKVVAQGRNPDNTIVYSESPAVNMRGPLSSQNSVINAQGGPNQSARPTNITYSTLGSTDTLFLGWQDNSSDEESFIIQACNQGACSNNDWVEIDAVGGLEGASATGGTPVSELVYGQGNVELPYSRYPQGSYVLIRVLAQKGNVKVPSTERSIRIP